MLNFIFGKYLYYESVRRKEFIRSLEAFPGLPVVAGEQNMNKRSNRKDNGRESVLECFEILILLGIMSSFSCCKSADFFLC